MIALPQPVKTALDRLNADGREAYLVGGCVRDYLMGATPKDFDITTSALPGEVERVFADCRVIETGLKHGTVTVLIGGLPLEITTFRVDSTYADHRHPDAVRFTGSLREDLARRDFTMNAIAYNERSGIVDAFGGEQDIREKTVRCVGDAETRFTEDALRMLRALRFSSVLGFSIEKNTSAAIHQKKALLQSVSAERIAQELIKLLCGKNVRSVLMEYVDVLGVSLPELLPMRGFDQRSKYHCYDLLEHTARVTEAVPPTPVLRLAALLHDVGKPERFTVGEDGAGHFYGHPAVSERIAREVLTRLKLDNLTRDTVCRIALYHDAQIEPTEKSVRRALAKYSPELLHQLLQIKRADCLAQAPAYRNRLTQLDALGELIDQVLAEQPCLTLKQLAVNGSDLIQNGIPAGRPVGAALQGLLDAVIGGDVKNERSALLGYLKRL